MMLGLVTLLMASSYLFPFLFKAVNLTLPLFFLANMSFQVRVNFLPVGHTHEDVDQLFSKIATHLNRVGAETLQGNVMTVQVAIFKYKNKPPDLINVTKQSYTPVPTVVLLEKIFDVRLWLAPSIHQIHGHSQPHCFRFKLDNDQAVMHYKNWSHECWSETPIVMLKVSCNTITIKFNNNY